MNGEFYQLKVKDVKTETFDTKSYTLDLNGVSEDFDYVQGQHVFVKMKIAGTEYLRPYSMSSSPYEGDLTFTVKRLRSGVVSNYINDHIKPGDEIEVMPPQGSFYTELNPDNEQDYYFVGAGSGITPLLSLIKSILHAETKSRIFLFYGNRNEDAIIFYDELNQLQAANPNRFFVEYILSSPKKEKRSGLLGYLGNGEISWDGSVGNIKEKTLHHFFQKYPVKNSLRSTFFLCGPQGVIDTSQDFLVKMGVAEEQILTESFYREYEDLHPGGQIKSCKTTVRHKGETFVVDIDDSRPILDSLLKNDVIIPFACRSGLCSSCVVKIVKGQVHCRETKGLPDNVRELGYVLSCQSTPASEELEIDYDSKIHTLN